MASTTSCAPEMKLPVLVASFRNSLSYTRSSESSRGLRNALSPNSRTKRARHSVSAIPRGLQGIRPRVSPPRNAVRAAFPAARLYASARSGETLCSSDWLVNPCTKSSAGNWSAGCVWSPSRSRRVWLYWLCVRRRRTTGDPLRRTPEICPASNCASAAQLRINPARIAGCALMEQLLNLEVTETLVLLRFAEYGDKTWGRLQPCGESSARLSQVPACLSSGTEVPRRLKPAPHCLSTNSANLSM